MSPLGSCHITGQFKDSNFASHIAPHQAVCLAGWAFFGLSGKKQGEGHDVFRGLDPLAVFLEDRARLLGI